MSDDRHDDPLQDDPRDIYGKIDALLGRRVGFAPPSEVDEFDDFPLLTDVVVQDGADDPAAYARSGEGSSGIAFAAPDHDAAGFVDAEFTPASLPDLGVTLPHYDLGVTLPHYDLGGPAGSEDGIPQTPIEMPGHDAAEFADAAFRPANVPDPSIISPHENLADPAVLEQGSLQAPIEMPDLDAAESPEAEFIPTDLPDLNAIRPPEYLAEPAFSEDAAPQVSIERPDLDAGESVDAEFTPTNLPDLGIIPPHYDLDLIEPLPLGPLEEGLSELIARQQAQLEAMIRRVVREELERHQRSLE